MVKFWVNRIHAGKATIDDVPERWREAVRLEINFGEVRL